MKPFIRTIIAGSLSSFAILLPLAAAAQQPEVVDRIVAVIEDEIITLRELETKAAPFLAQAEGKSTEQEGAAQRQEILAKVLDIQISEKIVEREIAANSDKLGVTDAEIDRAIAEVQRMNNLTREQLQAALYGQGMTWSEYRSKLREQMERTRLIQYAVQGKVQVKEPDVKRRCEQRRNAENAQFKVCAAHILLKAEVGASAAEVESIRARAVQLQAEVTAGADFSAYALKYSQDTGAPDGMLGCFGKGEMVEAFEEAAFATPIGKISGVVQTNFGFHIIKVVDRKSTTASCESAEELAPFREEIFQAEMERQITIWTDSLRRKAFVEVRL